MNKTALLQPYLNFNGNCKEAMEFYQKIMGGTLTFNTFGQMDGEQSSPETKDQIMHAYLQNDALSFMASDGGPMGTIKFGENVHLSINGTDEERLTKIFEGLSEGGTVKMPLAPAPWGDTFGMLTDKFGVQWMVSIGETEPKH